MTTYYADHWALTEVWYSEEWDVWMTTAYDREGNQVGESEADFRKADAEDTAFAYLDSGRCNIVQVKNKKGIVQQQYKQEIA
jgi:hypothetical protein